MKIQIEEKALMFLVVFWMLLLFSAILGLLGTLLKTILWFFGAEAPWL
jgi:hypothetical protein